MRGFLSGIEVAGVFLGMVLLGNSARAQPLPPNRRPLLPYSSSPFAARVSISTTFTRPFGAIGIQSSVSVPNGATVRLGGYATSSTGRNEFGPPGLGRPFRNTGLGRGTTGSLISVSVRIIDLREEERRQTGLSR